MFEWFGKVNFVPYTRVSDFARHLKDGYLMGSRCKRCSEQSFPPRADCGACLSSEFEFVEISGKSKLLTFTKIVAAPTGFEEVAPYTVGVADLEDGDLAALNEWLARRGIHVSHLALEARSLEDVFMEATGAAEGDGAAEPAAETDSDGHQLGEVP